MQAQADAQTQGGAEGWDDELPDEDWERWFAEEAEDDGEALRELADAAARETPGDVTARLGMLLLDTAREKRAELLTREALKLAEGALADLVRLHASRGLATLLAALDEDIAAESSLAVRQRLEEFRRLATDPTLIARVLAHGDDNPGEGDEASGEALLRLLDDGAIRALVEWSFGEQAGDEAAGAGLVAALGARRGGGPAGARLAVRGPRSARAPGARHPTAQRAGPGRGPRPAAPPAVPRGRPRGRGDPRLVRPHGHPLTKTSTPSGSCCWTAARGSAAAR
ncbi:MAG: hypothetical protein H6742_17150 [Alphaproteobacteria bacterium]|nr:hypothetical protein [Alphaproteobacteria bacterium]